MFAVYLPISGIHAHTLVGLQSHLVYEGICTRVRQNCANTSVLLQQKLSLHIMDYGIAIWGKSQDWKIVLFCKKS